MPPEASRSALVVGGAFFCWAGLLFDDDVEGVDHAREEEQQREHEVEEEGDAQAFVQEDGDGGQEDGEKDFDEVHRLKLRRRDEGEISAAWRGI